MGTSFARETDGQVRAHGRRPLPTIRKPPSRNGAIRGSGVVSSLFQFLLSGAPSGQERLQRTISEIWIFAVPEFWCRILLRLCADPMKAKQHQKGEKALFTAGVRGNPLLHDPVLKRAVSSTTSPALAGLDLRSPRVRGRRLKKLGLEASY